MKGWHIIVLILACLMLGVAGTLLAVNTDLFLATQQESTQEQEQEQAQVQEWLDWIRTVVEKQAEIGAWRNEWRDYFGGRTGRDVEEHLYDYLGYYDELYVLVSIADYPPVCSEAHDTLLQCLGTYRSMILLRISYNSTHNESDRLEANSRAHEANVLYQQFRQQYDNIQSQLLESIYQIH